MFGGNVRPSHGRTADAAHGGAKSGKSLEDNKPKGPGNGEPEPEAAGIMGDGYHHVEIHENESGAHVKHTSPDGQETHSDHADTKEALKHAHKLFGHEDLGRENDHDSDDAMQHSEDAEEGPDFSAAYRR